MAGRRILMVANKWWEADPLCAVLIHDKARPKALTKFAYPHYPASRAAKPAPGAPRPPDPPAVPRITFDCNGDAVEVWCLEELMNPAENPSSSAEKARVLSGAISFGAAPDLVIAFGTAGSRAEAHLNGSVVIGRRTFTHDPLSGEPNRQGLWTPPSPDQLVDSGFPVGKFMQIDEQARYAAEARFLRPPVAPSDPPMVLLGNGLVALGVVNITNYDDYVWADLEAAEAFKKAGVAAQIGSVETTHGVIRCASPAPFLFVSGMTDTEGLFDFQVTPRVYAQNFVAAHNAAVAIAWLLPSTQAQL